MSTRVVLDSGVLGMVVHRSNEGKLSDCKRWLRKLLAQGGYVYIPEIVDYELRRKLLHLEFKSAVARLDALTMVCHYVQLSTASMRRAAALWARRNRGAILLPLTTR